MLTSPHMDTVSLPTHRSIDICIYRYESYLILGFDYLYLTDKLRKLSGAADICRYRYYPLSVAEPCAENFFPLTDNILQEKSGKHPGRQECLSSESFSEADYG